MGHLQNKYTSDYFLGAEDAATGSGYGVIGYQEFNENKTHQAFLGIYSFAASFAGNLIGKDILDIGFGRGDIIPLLLEDGINSYHGIDFSSNALAIATKRITDPKVKLELKEAVDIDVTRRYDIVLMTNVIEQIPVFEMERVWRKIHKVLRPGGCVIVTTPIFKDPNIPDDTDRIFPVMGIHCHKQTMGTMLRTCLQHDLICATFDESTFGLILKKDLSLFEETQRRSFMDNHKKMLMKYGLNEKEPCSQEDLRTLVPGPGRLVIGCVTENNDKYRSQTLRLVKSIRLFGGNASAVNIFVCIVDSADPSFVEELEKWGVFVRIVKRFNPSHPPSNKLRFFELDEVNYYDTIMFLDCDTIVVQDPLPYIDGENFQADIAAGVSVPHAVFTDIFEHYNLPLPNEYHLTSISEEPTIWYCNAGVLIFPKTVLQSFFPKWKEYTEDIISKEYLLKNYYFFCEQVSLTLAYIERPIPFKRLPLAMNFHSVRRKTNHIKNCDPIIIHYHYRVDEQGFIKEKTGSRYATNRIKEFNRYLKNHNI